MATYLKTANFNELYKELCKIYRTEDARTIAGQAELQMAAINWGGIALNTWDSVISQAEYEGKIIPLIESAIKFNNGDEQLEKIKTAVAQGEAIEKAVVFKKEQHRNFTVAEERVVKLLLINHS